MWVHGSTYTIKIVGSYLNRQILAFINIPVFTDYQIVSSRHKTVFSKA